MASEKTADTRQSQPPQDKVRETIMSEQDKNLAVAENIVQSEPNIDIIALKGRTYLKATSKPPDVFCSQQQLSSTCTTKPSVDDLNMNKDNVGDIASTKSGSSWNKGLSANSSNNGAASLGELLSPFASTPILPAVTSSASSWQPLLKSGAAFVPSTTLMKLASNNTAVVDLKNDSTYGCTKDMDMKLQKPDSMTRNGVSGNIMPSLSNSPSSTMPTSLSKPNGKTPVESAFSFSSGSVFQTGDAKLTSVTTTTPMFMPFSTSSPASTLSSASNLYTVKSAPTYLPFGSTVANTQGNYSFATPKTSDAAAAGTAGGGFSFLNWGNSGTVTKQPLSASSSFDIPSGSSSTSNSLKRKASTGNAAVAAVKPTTTSAPSHAVGKLSRQQHVISDSYEDDDADDEKTVDTEENRPSSVSSETDNSFGSGTNACSARPLFTAWQQHKQPHATMFKPSASGANCTKDKQRTSVTSSVSLPASSSSSSTKPNSGLAAGEVSLFCERAKLYRFDTTPKPVTPASSTSAAAGAGVWKERGLGQIQLILKPSKQIVCIMHCDQTQKLCCNHIIHSPMHCKSVIPLAADERTTQLVWYAKDYSSNDSSGSVGDSSNAATRGADASLELRDELFRVKFKRHEQAMAFQRIFEQAVSDDAVCRDAVLNTTGAATDTVVLKRRNTDKIVAAPPSRPLNSVPSLVETTRACKRSKKSDEEENDDNCAATAKAAGNSVELKIRPSHPLVDDDDSNSCADFIIINPAHHAPTSQPSLIVPETDIVAESSSRKEANDEHVRELAGDVAERTNISENSFVRSTDQLVDAGDKS